MIYALFTDVSLNPKQKTGLGAYLVVSHALLDIQPDNIDTLTIIDKIVFRNFTDTSSTKLELQTALWAIQDYMKKKGKAAFTLYTDSQCISGLMKRRYKLETNNYFSKRTNALLKHALLYKSFYALSDTLGFNVEKVTGHMPSHLHNTVHRIFSYVDKEVRKQFKTRYREL